MVSRILFVDTIFLNLLTTNIVSSIADWNEPFQVLYFFANLDELVVLYLNISHLSLTLSTDTPSKNLSIDNLFLPLLSRSLFYHKLSTTLDIKNLPYKNVFAAFVAGAIFNYYYHYDHNSNPNEK